MGAITNISTYRFAELRDLADLRADLLALCKDNGLKGTILLATEGINLFVAGDATAIGKLLARLRAIPGLENLEPKVSLSEDQPFNRMLVRIKKEIISFGMEEVNPARHTSPKLAPRELKRWLDEGRPVTLLDTRNDYEVKLGTFHGAIDPNIRTFRGFPAAVRELPENLKDQPVVMFCTGGIRCEKAGPFMEMEGFREIYQLDGGILKYFEECGSAHYEGDCFVFDQRVGVDPALQESGHAVCHACLAPLDHNDQNDSQYVAGESCPGCFRSAEARMAENIRELEEAIFRATNPLPGAHAEETRRPVHISASYHKWTLLDALCAMHPQVPRKIWHERIADGRLISYGGDARAAEHVVHAGERILHVQAPSVEPDVAADIRVLFMDEALLVVDKPAPLPMHSGGRFHRNTLQHILNLALHPRVPRPVHRLDANTSGVVVYARTRHAARVLQQEFINDRVEKEYRVWVQGHPADDEFSCAAPISSEPGENGLRVVTADGQEAFTRFRVLRRDADGTALLSAFPRTGRTNQIRVHLQSLGFPVVGDPSYGKPGAPAAPHTLSLDSPRMCLHAARISFAHPISGERLEIRARSAPF
ncbi:MAG: RluA family pseudouridine synthase [Verrucomicrobiota bacterium]